MCMVGVFGRFGRKCLHIYAVGAVANSVYLFGRCSSKALRVNSVGVAAKFCICIR